MANPNLEKGKNEDVDRKTNNPTEPKKEGKLIPPLASEPTKSPENKSLQLSSQTTESSKPPIYQSVPAGEVGNGEKSPTIASIIKKNFKILDGIGILYGIYLALNSKWSWLILVVVLITIYNLISAHPKVPITSKGWKIWGTGIVPVVLLFGLFLISFLNITSPWVQKTFWPTQLSTIAPEETPTTPSPMDGPTPTPSHPLPTTAQPTPPTSTLTQAVGAPTFTPTPTYPAEEFTNSCIPDYWKLHPTSLMTYYGITPSPCPIYKKIGYEAYITPGLQVNYQRPTAMAESNIGIYRAIPSGNFDMTVILQNINLVPPPGYAAKFYIMFLNSGKVNELDFSKAFMFSVDSESAPGVNSAPFLAYEKIARAYTITAKDRIIISCAKRNLTYSCSVNGITISPTITPDETWNNDWDSVYIGYYADYNAKVGLDITSFHINPIP